MVKCVVGGETRERAREKTEEEKCIFGTVAYHC